MTEFENHYRPVEQLIYNWARTIDEDRVEQITDFMQESGRYRVKSRFNHDRELPLAVIDCKGVAQLRDRILSMRNANIYQPHHYRHMISCIQILSEPEPNVFEVRSNFLITRTMDLSGDMKIFASGQTQDLISFQSSAPQFKDRLFLYDSRVVETLMIIPL